MRDVGKPWRRSAGQISPVSWQANAAIMSTLNGVPAIAALDRGLELALEPEHVLGVGHVVLSLDERSGAARRPRVIAKM